MARTVTVGNEEFELPVQGDNPDFGETLTDYFVAVADALGTVQAPNDIPSTTASILNNQASFTNISGFIFDSSEVIAINSEFIIVRTTVSPANNLVESGFIQGNFDGTSWNWTVESVGNAGIDWNITSAGQLQYKSTDVSGTSYTGTVLFRGRVFNS